ncbi:MAG: branched-chain amino acid ABC transporter permease [Deltaproteobacteria bacterium]|nr:branched-chain amino acid ABC transporter permease [Deltaproteobacteria bacterium]MBW2120261.1 branched-chain amino acid ABC transporter permease [Deltaproteobacteria bacterium]
MDILGQLPQLIAYGLISGSIITLGAIGLSLTYGILNFANFAHGDVMALGAFLALALLGLVKALGVPAYTFGPLSFGLPMAIALVSSMGLTAVAAIVIDRILYRRFRESGSIVLLIASVGVAFVLRNIIQFIWSPLPNYYFKKIQISKRILGIRIKPDEIFIIIFTAAAAFCLHLFLTRTKMGKAMRATSDNAELAKVTGIDTERVVLWTWGIGAALAASGGVLAGIEDKFITPELGWQLLLYIFAAVILGGIGSPYGAVLGGIIIGLSTEISTAFVNTAYKPAVAFIILVVMLLFRPTGLVRGK